MTQVSFLACHGKCLARTSEPPEGPKKRVTPVCASPSRCKEPKASITLCSAIADASLASSRISSSASSIVHSVASKGCGSVEVLICTIARASSSERIRSSNLAALRRRYSSATPTKLMLRTPSSDSVRLRVAICLPATLSWRHGS
jgi:hypothetical protein